MSFIGNVPAESYSPVVKDTFSGNDSTTDFTLSIPATTNSVEVFVENVQQEPTDAYTISGTTLSFTAAPVTGTNNIYVIHRGPAVQQVVPPGDSITTAMIQDDAVTAAKIAVTGNGTSGQALTSDGDGTMSWTTLSADKIEEGNSSVEVVDTGTGYVAVTVDGSETARFDANGRLGIGTASPAYNLTVGTVGSDVNTSIQIGSATNSNGYLLFGDGSSGADAFRGIVNYDHANDWMIFSTNATEQMRLTSGGDLRFNSGYGSVATAYGCRAWVNFNGTGTVAIRASGNVSSITDNGTGQYTVNFSSAMPDTNFCTVTDSANTDLSNATRDHSSLFQSTGLSTTSIRVRTGATETNANEDHDVVNVQVVR